MKDYNQLFVRGLDYVQCAVVNWDIRRSKLIRSYVESSAFIKLGRPKDRHIALILLLEERIGEVFLEYRNYQAQQKEVDKLFSDICIQVSK